MRNLFFIDSLELEINVIEYHQKGESILFFIRADGYAVYTGLVDCFRTEDLNVVKTLLEKEQITGNIEDESSCAYGYGMIKTVFDILQRKEYIETELIGDAIPYKREMIG